MQTELDAEYPDLGIEIVGVNEAGHESANATICEGRDLPWLQDTNAADWWGRWSPTYRDVVILDGQGELADVYNLTSHPVTDQGNYDELKGLLVELAQGQ